MRIYSLCLLAGLSLGTAALAQDPTPQATPPDNRHHGQHGKMGRHGKMGGMMKDLTPQERQTVKDARAKAIQDPQVKAARERLRQSGQEFRDAQRSALIAADPAMEGILKKMEQSRSERSTPGGGHGAQPTPSVPPPPATAPAPAAPPQG